MIIDTSALLAFFDTNEPMHGAVSSVLEPADDLLVVSPYVLAELDYLLMTRQETRAQVLVLDELRSGAWELATFDTGRLAKATEIVRRYHDIPIGLADASLVVLAAEYSTDQIVTLDRRHFSILRHMDGRPLRLLPQEE